MNDSTTIKTTTRRYGNPATAKKASKATKVAGSKKAPAAKPGKATKPAKVTAAQLKAAAKLLASQNPLEGARAVLKAAGCKAVMVAAEGPGGFFSDADPMPPALCKLARASVRSAGDRFELDALKPRAA